jgi:putative transposase
VPQSLTFLLIHVVFSTRERRPFLTEPTRSALHAYLATIARDHDCECFRVGGTADHVHLAIRLGRTTTVASLVNVLKSTSSQWLKAQNLNDFAWQNGYGAFSVGRSDLDQLVQYIEHQERHHQNTSFQDELRAILKRYGIETDERYLWD